jgi:hypothetical protein
MHSTVIILQLQKGEFIVEIWCMKIGEEKTQREHQKGLLSFLSKGAEKKKGWIIFKFL